MKKFHFISWIFLILINLFLLDSQAESKTAKFSVSLVKGRSTVDGEKATINSQVKVGSVLSANGEGSFIDGDFLGAKFRVQNGSLNIQEMNIDKFSRDVMYMDRGKLYFYLDKTFGNNFFQVSTPHIILSVLGKKLTKPTKVYLVVQKSKTMVYMLNGMMEVTFAKTRKKDFIAITDGEYLEHDGLTKPSATLLNRPAKDKQLERIFAEFAPPHDNKEVYWEFKKITEEEKQQIMADKKAYLEKQSKGKPGVELEGKVDKKKDSISNEFGSQ